MMAEKEFNVNHKNLVNLINIHRNAAKAYNSMSAASLLFQRDPKVSQGMTNMNEVLDSTLRAYNDALNNILSSNNVMVINEVDNKTSFTTFISEKVLEKLSYINLSNEDIAKFICDTLSETLDQILEKIDKERKAELSNCLVHLAEKKKNEKKEEVIVSSEPGVTPKKVTTKKKEEGLSF